MRVALAVLFGSCSLSMLAQGAAWSELLERAQREKKPLVVFFRADPCERCDSFERVSVAHPMIERRMPSVVFAVLPAKMGEDSHIAFFDRAGTPRVRWPFVPDTTNLGIILDSAVAVAPQFERAVQLSEAGAPGDGELEAAIALARLGRFSDARAALACAREYGSPEARQTAIVTNAVLDANDGKAAEALIELQQVAANAATSKIAADAHAAITAIQHGVAPAPPPSRAIRILPLGRQVVSGPHTVKTQVVSADVAQVSFALDGQELARIQNPPFSVALDFGAMPQRHSIRVTAFDRKGREIGRDERVVNEAGEMFWVRLTAPEEGPVGGAVRVSMNVRTPGARRMRRVVVSWNDAERAVLKAAPWESSIRIPHGQVGVLRAVAELDDGRTSEDAVLLNAGGVAGEANVQLVELPITVSSRRGAVPEITPAGITVREGDQVRRVEAVATAAETPLTVGLLIDVSDSMQKTLPDLQEAAIRFVQTILGERDRAFLVTFDSYAHLIQPATSDITLLRREIMRIRPNGLTALNDAMVLGLLQFEGIKGRRAMIVFSDGLDRTSHYRPEEVSELSRRVNVPIHVIESIPIEPSDGELKRVARATGGSAHTLEQLAELPKVYAQIEAALRAQFLAFVRTDPATRENEWRTVRVEVRGEDLKVYAPEGYYAGW
ncbi:MAG TPA: VWA domain-containing protein [Thermoanaerobaculia bacterium]|jgi:VWFA-related protein|nr:VWA domain-containing protein [Thermoanaerobaculia bacterium]